MYYVSMDSENTGIVEENQVKADLVGGTCQVCGFPMNPGEEIWVCDHCETPHHSDCWVYAKGCSTFACKGSLRKLDESAVVDQSFLCGDSRLISLFGKLLNVYFTSFLGSLYVGIVFSLQVVFFYCYSCYLLFAKAFLKVDFPVEFFRPLFQYLTFPFMCLLIFFWVVCIFTIFLIRCLEAYYGSVYSFSPLIGEKMVFVLDSKVSLSQKFLARLKRVNSIIYKIVGVCQKISFALFVVWSILGIYTLFCDISKWNFSGLFISVLGFGFILFASVGFPQIVFFVSKAIFDPQAKFLGQRHSSLVYAFQKKLTAKPNKIKGE